ncbi:GNAT family N-acetyltransferase [Paraburkholderia sp. MMS20-SJTR3]|uniref:GNAT family N-acetyltransferase n=1 Tax=Paraburkholderia sejongensis TaxID=2886946 RepID=A0ABS8JRT2_9BURK|nr:GNAT family N-acetyltransferase [Paraburkholderia sp. MMS20-SJTR3]MCC8392601.1 GNAT family N-acetyltransferase [Paraburkholderia sp. MMS20-SJTR3]
MSVDSIDGLGALRGVWDTLAAQADNPSLCEGYPYCELAASIAFEQRMAVRVLLLREGHDLVALWPFVIERRALLRVARRLTCGAREEYGQPLVKLGVGDDIWPALMTALKRLDADLVEVSRVANGTRLQAALDTAPQSRAHRLLPSSKRGHPGYAIGLRGFASFVEFENASLSSRFRQVLRKCRRRLEQLGPVESGWCDTPEETTRLLGWIIEQKRAWAAARSIENEYLEDDRIVAFFSRLAQRLDLSKTPLVAFLKVDGLPVAASLNMVGGQTLEGGVTTYDPAFGEYSVGSLHLYDLLKWAHARGLDFDLRPVHVDYKERWATHRSWHETRELLITARGRLVDVAHLHNYAQRGARKLLRETVRRMRPAAKAPEAAKAAQPGK